ncbi:metal-dependent hydrolase [Chengkuizengella axinellae]|uniref:Metal-dependent hydrolase n=1 Tax=Chengkuizengella axinellae TaxID=3064388 RepID=A0ABT9IT69_9BACL|nr:metal-dependent hydrolase [Chengkuizengella sp. 2205SS18-9]MDP5272538.1 metal-dependent hydrolase [Chengkuizengella sp. 2205SS18-9]
MDSGTHFVVGLGLAGMATVDPVVAADPKVFTAVLVGTALGSQAPDSDGLFRLKGNAAYIKNHRGLSHSLPALFIWSFLITGLLFLIFQNIPVLNVMFWVFLAVCVHVFSDLFNTYGTQALRPLSDKWISWNIIHIFDPIIFFSHVFALVLWAFQIVNASLLFPILYGCLVIYYIWRTLIHYFLQKNLFKKDATYQKGDSYILIPTIRLSDWKIVKENTVGVHFQGELKKDHQIEWIDEVKCKSHPAIEASKQNSDIAAFLYFSSEHACSDLRQHDWGYEIRWFDVRFRHRKQYPFVGVILMNKEYKTIKSYVGWINDEKLEKRLGVNETGI